MYFLSNNREDFLNLPKKLYENDPFYMVKNETIQQAAKLFVIPDIARAAVIYNPELKYQDKKTAQIGFFEAQNNIEAVQYLFEEIKKYCVSEGFERIIGPINGSTWQKYRVTLPSSNLPFFLDNYNKSYYAGLFENSGFNHIARYTSTVHKSIDKDYDRLVNYEKLLNEKGIIIRKIDENNFENELKIIYDISIQSFVNNFLYTPITFKEFYKMYEPVKSMVKSEFILIAEDSDKKPLAFVFALDNLFEKNKKSLVIKTLAKIPSSIKGLGAYLTEKLHQIANQNGYDEIIHALMYDSNVSANILADGAELLHGYVLYGTEI